MWEKEAGGEVLFGAWGNYSKIFWIGQMEIEGIENLLGKVLDLDC